MIGDQWFQKLSTETCAKIYLCKAKQYMSMLDELRAVINGSHYEENECPSGTLSIADPWAELPGEHCYLGSDHTCKDCSLYMVEIFAKKLSDGSY